MPKRGVKRIVRWIGALLAVGVGTYMIGTLFVPLLGPGWHLLHGDYISHETWRIPVPRKFFVRYEMGHPTMWKLGIGTPLVRGSYAHITLFTTPGKQPFLTRTDLDQFEARVTRVEREDGNSLRSAHSVVMGDTSSYCLEFAGANPEARYLVRCAVGNTPLVFYYEGERQYVADFYSMIEGMSLEKPVTKTHS